MTAILLGETRKVLKISLFVLSESAIIFVDRCTAIQDMRYL
jgi:hypothetical protein